MKLLSEQIKIISPEEGKLLEADKLSKNRQISTGLYLVCNINNYTAYDYSDRQYWIEYYGSSNAPEGWSKEFCEPLSAIDWLFLTKK